MVLSQRCMGVDSGGMGGMHPPPPPPFFKGGGGWGVNSITSLAQLSHPTHTQTLVGPNLRSSWMHSTVGTWLPYSSPSRDLRLSHCLRGSPNCCVRPRPILWSGSPADTSLPSHASSVRYTSIRLSGSFLTIWGEESRHPPPSPPSTHTHTHTRARARALSSDAIYHISRRVPAPVELEPSVPRSRCLCPQAGAFEHGAIRLRVSLLFDLDQPQTRFSILLHVCKLFAPACR